MIFDLFDFKKIINVNVAGERMEPNELVLSLKEGMVDVLL